MVQFFRLLCVGFAGLAALLMVSQAAQAQYVDYVFPEQYPAADRDGRVTSGGASLFYAEWGQGDPVVLLHGGTGSIENFAYLIPDLAPSYHVIGIDSRGHGRSTRDETPYSYSLMADDVIAVMDELGLEQAAFVGWSDGGVILLDMAIRYPERITRGFMLGASYNLDGTDLSALDTDPLFIKALTATAEMYQRISTTPSDYADFIAHLSQMWSREPNYTPEQLQSITTPLVVAHGLDEEAVSEAHALEMAALIPGARYLPLENMSHFAFWQDPAAFNAEVLAFLK